MTVALLSNVTVTSLAMRLNKDAREEVYSPTEYNTWLQELSDPGSALYASDPGIVFIILHGASLLGDDGAKSPEEAAATLTPMAGAIGRAAASHEKTVFVASTLDIPIKKIRPLVSRSFEQHACAFWREEMEKRGIPLVELAEMAAVMGREHFYNNRVWYMGSLPFSKSGEEAIASEIGRIQRAITGARKKCLALDLDGTLWGGAIGELGVEGVHLDLTGSGSRFRDFQRRVLDLKESGVLLAVISKNNLEDAMSGITEHPAMLLREGDFAAIRANWAPKAENLRSVAKELNIGTDSFVFIDDNPVEREAMQIDLPEVAVPDFPTDSAQLEGFMTQVARDYFLQFRATDDDRTKTGQYRAEADRREHLSSFASMDEYLASLDMTLTVGGLTRSNISRASQLTQKTNQFNLTAIRYSEAQIREAACDPAVRLYLGELRDRFGEYGNIALCIARLTGEPGKTGQTASIETFLMSCRVMGRGVESAFLDEVERNLRGSGVSEIETLYQPTPKNEAVRDFWEKMGYTITGRTEGGGVKYSRPAGTKARGSVTIRVRQRKDTAPSCPDS
ncbi:MAG: HAD-IIIC family phosphatase [Synergistaceae bacterium]|jgi:FkbH-like protein|nr:HAD-IIIC family phosphatase [Synergistaceae bacterium]